MTASRLLSELPRPLSDWRCVLDYPGADIGEKINAAVADLPDEGGVVLLPDGSHTIETPVLIDKDGVALKGVGTFPGAVWTYCGTRLVSSITTAPPISIGVAGSTTRFGVCLEGFGLTQTADTTYPLVHVVKAAWGHIRDFHLYGSKSGVSWGGRSAVGMKLGGPDGNYASYGWRLRDVHVNYAEDGLVAEASHGLQVFGGLVYGCRRGIVIGENQTPTGIGFHGFDVENNVIGFDVRAGRVLSWHNTYMEGAYGPGTVEEDMYLFRIGAREKVLGMVINGLYVQLGRVQGLKLAGLKTAAGWDYLIQNVATDVDDVVIECSDISCPLTDDYTGIRAILGCGDKGQVCFPNLPTSDPARDGELWLDSGTLKVSTEESSSSSGSAGSSSSFSSSCSSSSS